jgi:DNA-binding MarR family transcriptional regulator
MARRPTTPARPAAQRAKPGDGPVEPSTLDLGHLALFVGQAVAASVQQAIEKAGFGGLRFSHGFVIQHLVDEPRTIGELARRMGVSQQAASKVVAELEALGYVERTGDDGDARIRRVGLSRRGRAAIAAGRRARLRLEQRLETRCGAADMAAARDLLSRALTELGGADAVRARRVAQPR